jgi:hypothetical protein
MRAFFSEYPEEVRDNVEYQMDKMTDEGKRYAVQVRKAYGEHFVRRGLEQARQRQIQILRNPPSPPSHPRQAGGPDDQVAQEGTANEVTG